MLAYVLNCHGKPLMPCHPAKARILLKQGKAKVVSRKPFVIQLTHGSSGYKQSAKLGVDSGYKYVGLSVYKKQHGSSRKIVETIAVYKAIEKDSGLASENKNTCISRVI